MKQPFSQKEKRLVSLWIMLGAALCVPQAASAMHIMEGYLPPSFCVAWSVLCLPFLAVGVVRLGRLTQNRKLLILLAMAGAFVFVISSLKIPSVSGSCSHMTGTGLAAILFGVPVASILGIIVLVFQALLLAHGGLTTLGANTFSMAIAGPLVSWAVYALAKRFHVSRKVAVFLAAALGDLFTYCVTSLQLAVAYPAQEGGIGASAVAFLGVFAPTQLPLAVLEGILTVMILSGLESYAQPELQEIGFLERGRSDR